MSTHVGQSTLKLIFNYGWEALGNRRKDLFLITFVFIFLPQLALTLAWAESSRQSVRLLDDLANKSPLAVISGIFELTSQYVLMASILAFLLGALGVLALARTSVDYFESRPSTLTDVLPRSLRVLVTKGLGTLLFLVIIFPILAVMPLLRAIATSMLLMLPITLVVGSKGGFKTSLDTLFLKYASPTQTGRWPRFINVLSFAGIFLTLLFGFTLLIEFGKVMDTWLQIPAGLLERDIRFLHYNVGFGEFFAHLLGLIWSCVWWGAVMPFAAATYHLSTTPEYHVKFEAEV